MAAEIAEADLGDGRKLYFEEDLAPIKASSGLTHVSVADAVDYETALDTIRAAAAKLADKLMDLPRPPDGYEIAFGVKLSAAVGAILAKTGAEANFSVKLTWSGKKP